MLYSNVPSQAGLRLIKSAIRNFNPSPYSFSPIAHDQSLSLTLNFDRITYSTTPSIDKILTL